MLCKFLLWRTAQTALSLHFDWWSSVCLSPAWCISSSHLRLPKVNFTLVFAIMIKKLEPRDTCRHLDKWANLVTTTTNPHRPIIHIPHSRPSSINSMCVCQSSISRLEILKCPLISSLVDSLLSYSDKSFPPNHQHSISRSSLSRLHYCQDEQQHDFSAI